MDKQNSKLSDQNLKTIQQLYYLKEIERGMETQKNLVDGYLDKYQINSTWDKIKKGFLYRGLTTRLRRLVKLVPCDIEAHSPIYLLPGNISQKIFVCYNKIQSYDHLQKELTRKLILTYDIIGKGIDLSDVKQLAHSQIKSLNLSKMCRRDDKSCFDEHIKDLCSHQQQFKGKKHIFDEVFNLAIHDVQPMNELRF